MLKQPWEYFQIMRERSYNKGGEALFDDVNKKNSLNTFKNGLGHQMSRHVFQNIVSSGVVVL